MIVDKDIENFMKIQKVSCKNLQNVALEKIKDFKANFLVYVYETSNYYPSLVEYGNNHIIEWENCGEDTEKTFDNIKLYFDVGYYTWKISDICEKLDTVISILSASHYGFRIFGDLDKVEYIMDLKDNINGFFVFMQFSSYIYDENLFDGADEIYLPINKLTSELDKFYNLLKYC